jgi:hypothetical protein
MNTPARGPTRIDRLPMVLRGSLAADVLVFCGFVVATVVLTYPIAWHMSDSVPGYPPGDSFHYLWELWYPAHAIFDLRASPFLDPKVYSPFGFDLIRNQDLSPATVLLFAPLTRAFGEVVTYNLIVLMSFPLTAFGTYLLCRELWGSRLAAVVAGTAAAFCAYRVSHAQHLSLVTTQWIPFFFFYLERSIERPTRRNGLLAGLFYSLSALATWYYAVGCAISALLYVSVRLTARDRDRAKDLIRSAGAAAAVALVLVTPFVVPYAIGVVSGAMTDPPIAAQETYSASVADFFIPITSHPLWGTFILQHWRAGASGQWLSEWQIYLGIIPLSLALVGVCAGRRRTVWALIAIGIGMFVIALGPTLQITHQASGGGTGGTSLPSIPLPVRLLAFIPPFSLLRAWSRLAFFVEIVVAVLAARGLLVLLDHTPRLFAARTIVWRVAVTLIVLTLTVVDTLAVYSRSSVEPRAVDRWLAAQPGDFAIIEYPVVEHGWSGAAMYRRRVTGKRTVLGYGRNPPNQNFWPMLSRYPEPEALDLLRWWDVKYVLVDESLYRSGAEFWGVVHTWETLEPAMLNSGRLIERGVFDRVHLYELLDAPSKAVGAELLGNPGFEELADSGPAGWTRVGSPEEAILDTQSHSGKAAVSVTPNSFFVSDRIPVTPGRCYQVEQVNRGRVRDDQVRLQVNWLDESGRDLGASAALIRLFNAYPSWRAARTWGRAPAASRAARIYATAHQGQVFLDDYSFREITGPCAPASDMPDVTPAVRLAGPSLVAEPNPVPPTAGVGRTTIKWDTGKEPPGPVYVSENGAPEILFAGESQYGSQDAPWIGVGKTYEFRLYSGQNRERRLASVVVTSKAGPTLFATPNPVPAGPERGKTDIGWNTGDGGAGEVWVSINDGPEILFARNPQGSQEAGWIDHGSVYVFRLYKVDREKRLLASITVRRSVP